jgi:tetratricopeptide (TPR) repeat protein
MHALDYQLYAYLQLGREAEARAALDRINAIESLTSQHIGSAYALAAMPSRYVLERNQWADAAELTLHPAVDWSRAAPAKSVLVFARGLGAARSGDSTAAAQELEQLRALRDGLAQAGVGYWAGQAEIQATLVEGWLAFVQGNSDEALRLLLRATELEDATEKHPVTPGPIKPAHELLGELYLELERPELALAEFERTLETEPNRFLALYGAGRAAELSGDRAKAQRYYTELSDMADGNRPELQRAEAYVARR